MREARPCRRSSAQEHPAILHTSSGLVPSPCTPRDPHGCTRETRPSSLLARKEKNYPIYISAPDLGHPDLLTVGLGRPALSLHLFFELLLIFGPSQRQPATSSSTPHTSQQSQVGPRSSSKRRCQRRSRQRETASPETSSPQHLIIQTLPVSPSKTRQVASAPSF